MRLGGWENLEFRDLRFEGRFLDIGSLRSWRDVMVKGQTVQGYIYVIWFLGFIKYVSLSGYRNDARGCVTWEDR